MKLNSSPNDVPDTLMHKNVDPHGTNNDLEATLTRNLYYKEQVTNVPAEYYYHVGDISFDGYRDGILLDAKGEGMLKFIETNWTASVYGNGGLVDWALRRLEAVRNAGATTPIHWHIAEHAAFKHLSNLQTDGFFPSRICLVDSPPDYRNYPTHRPAPGQLQPSIMRWRLTMKRQALGDPISEGRRVWEWIQRIRYLHPSIALWLPTSNSHQESELAPPVDLELLQHRIHQSQTVSIFPEFGVNPAFCGQIGQGNKLMLTFNMPEVGHASVELMIGSALGNALDASEDLADALVHTTAESFAPNIIGGLSRNDHPTRNLDREGPAPFNYSDGWKMFFASDSPHYQRATQLATRTAPVANGAIFTFGTPDTYPTILNQW